MVNVVKLGGGAGVDHAAVLANLARRAAGGERWVLVHGASDRANQMAEAAGVAVRTLTTPGGHTSRYTDAAMIGIYARAAAAVNAELVAALAALDIEACGFPPPVVGRARRHAAIRALVNGRQVVVRDDHTGAITGVEAAVLEGLLDAGAVPVVAPIARGEAGEPLNVDGDLVAAHIARALGAARLVILSNVPGLLRDVHEPASLVPAFSLDALGRYEPLAHGRMKKKLMAAREAQVAVCILADSRGDAPLDAALAGAGTHIFGVGGDAALALPALALEQA